MTALERNIDHWMMNWALDVAALCVFDSEVRRGYGYVSDPGRLRNGYVLRFYDGEMAPGLVIFHWWHVFGLSCTVHSRSGVLSTKNDIYFYKRLCVLRHDTLTPRLRHSRSFIFIQRSNPELMSWDWYRIGTSPYSPSPSYSIPHQSP